MITNSCRHATRILDEMAPVPVDENFLPRNKQAVVPPHKIFADHGVRRLDGFDYRLAAETVF